MLATTKTVRILARYIYMKSFGYAGTFTDKCKKDDNMRHVAFRLYSKREADALANELETMLIIRGYTNKVKRTSSECNMRLRVGGGEYVRVKALLG